MTKADDASWEAVGTFLTRVDAEMARGALEAEGIDAAVSADDAAGTRPHLWMRRGASDRPCQRCDTRQVYHARG